MALFSTLLISIRTAAYSQKLSSKCIKMTATELNWSLVDSLLEELELKLNDL